MPSSLREAIARIPSWAGASSVTATPLGGGLTNATYRVDVDGEAYVVRIAASGTEVLGVDRHREYRCTLAASRAGVAPKVVCSLPDEGILVTRFIEGRVLSPEAVMPPDVLERVVRSMRRYHGGPAFAGTFSPFRTLEDYRSAASLTDAPLPEDLDALYRSVAGIETALQRKPAPLRPCHNDLWGPNLIDDGERVWIVDWEYAGMGDPDFDLASFAIHHLVSDEGDEALLRAYLGQVPAYPRQVPGSALARLKLMRIVAELREAMWYLVALAVSSETTDFVRLAQAHFERCRRALADARLGEWLRLAGGGA